MKVGILGCGYVGQAVASNWKQQGHYVTVTTRKLERIHELQTISDQVFILEKNNLQYFLANQEAILISVAPDPYSDYITTYLKTAQQVVENLPNAPQLQQIIYTSSTSVYGDYGGSWVNEGTEVHPTNERTAILHKTEQTLLRVSSSHLNVCILRLAEICGPGREIKNKLIRMQKESRSFPGDGKQFTNLIDLKDIVSAIDFAVQNQLNGIYNLCNDLHIPRQQLYEEICEQENLGSITWDPSLPSIHGGNKRVSNQKIKDCGFIFSKTIASL